MNNPGSSNPEPSSGLKPPRFSLRTLLWAFTIFGLLLTAYANFGSHVVAIFCLLALAILAHVAGNALGTQLRASGASDATDGSRSGGHGLPRRKPAAGDFAPVTKLQERSPLGRPIVIATAVGAVAGGVLGGIIFSRLLAEKLTLSSISIGIIAAAVLGGIWTFITSSFLQVAGGALWQALRESKR